MKRIVTLYMILLSLFWLTSCTKSLSPSEYVKYIQNSDNGLLLDETVNGVKYSLQYEPTEYVTLVELKSFVFPKDKFDSEYKRFQGIEHYVLHIDTKDLQNLISKSKDSSVTKADLINYLNFGIQKNIKLVENKDTIPCGIAECESGMNMFPYYSFVIGFPKREFDGDREFVFINKSLKTGDVVLTIKEKSLKNIPKLKVNG